MVSEKKRRRQAAKQDALIHVKSATDLMGSVCGAVPTVRMTLDVERSTCWECQLLAPDAPPLSSSWPVTQRGTGAEFPTRKD